MPFLGLPDRLADVRGRVDAAVQRGGHGQSVRLIAVTKTNGPDAVEAAYDAGVHDVGENKVQEALDKRTRVTGAAIAARWHMIGHLQSNKVRFLDGFHLVHSVDRTSLADTISTWGVKCGTPIDVLVQVNVVGEWTKGGYAPAMIEAEAARLRTLSGLNVQGVMAMAPFDATESVLRTVFQGAHATREILRAAGHAAHELSMGMSGDYEIAIEEGATMVRLGSVLFGAR